MLHARELLNDSQNVKALARSVKNAAGHLDDISRRYDFTSFAASLTAQYSSGSAALFSWVGYGQDVGVISRRREQVCTMLGPVGECFCFTQSDSCYHAYYYVNAIGKEVVSRAPQRERAPKEHNVSVMVSPTKLFAAHTHACFFSKWYQLKHYCRMKKSLPKSSAM